MQTYRTPRQKYRRMTPQSNHCIHSCQCEFGGKHSCFLQGYLLRAPSHDAHISLSHCITAVFMWLCAFLGTLFHEDSRHAGLRQCSLKHCSAAGFCNRAFRRQRAWIKCYLLIKEAADVSTAENALLELLVPFSSNAGGTELHTAGRAWLPGLPIERCRGSGRRK